MLRRTIERISGKKEQEENKSGVDLQELIDGKEGHYELDEDDRDYNKDFEKFEKQKAKLWNKNDFKSHLHVYAKQKYDKAVNFSAATAYKIYKRMYFDKIHNNPAVSIYNKVLYHPNLTEIDYDYLRGLQSKKFRNSAILTSGGIITASVVFFMYKKYLTKIWIPIIIISPALLFYGSYQFEERRLRIII
ncbi:hypothetical protein pb186bvf_000434 [Paramecium bursaria]